MGGSPALVCEMGGGWRVGEGTPPLPRAASLTPPGLSPAHLLKRNCMSGSSSLHSMHYFFTSVSDPGQAEPQFYSVGYVDGLPFVSYDVATRRMLPLVSWMEEVGKEDPHYWDRNSQLTQGTEAVSRVDLGTLRKRYNQSSSTGIHTWQAMHSCEVGPEGRPQAGHFQYGYDGEDFLSLDKESLTWTAPSPQAQVTKRKWEAERTPAQRWKAYLEETCVEWLWRYLEYGKETLLRTVPPTVKVARRKHLDGPETLYCQAHGFYPKEIEVSWMKDGAQQQDTLTGGVVPNWDGTYHKWLSIEVDPQDRDRYRCHVGHDGLEKPLDLAWEEPASSVIVGVLVGVLVGILLVAALVGGVIYFIKKRNLAKAPTGTEQGSDSSVKVPLAENKESSTESV